MTNKEVLHNSLNDLFNSFWESKNIDIETEYKSIPTNKFNACMMYLYNIYVNTLEITNSKGTKQYSYIDYINMIEWYISKCLDYDKITLYGFSLLINRNMHFLYHLRDCDINDVSNSFVFDIDINNINKECCCYNSVNNTINDYNNAHVVSKTTCDSIENLSAHIKDVTIKLFETLQQQTVNKLNDTPLGLVTNANNNKDVGLMYAKERIQEQTKARLTIALTDLPKLE